MKHRSYAWQGSAGAFEEAFNRAIAERGGEVEIRQIGGLAKYAVGPDEWRAEWIRVIDPAGVRLDLYAPDDTLDETFDAEAESLSSKNSLPIDPSKPTPLECDAQGACTVRSVGDLSRNLASTASGLHRGSIGALVAGGLVVAGGAVVIATMGSRRGVWRSVGVGGLIVGGALVAGGAALWSLVR